MGENNSFDIEEDEEMKVYKKDSTSVVFFKTVYQKDDLKPENHFQPLMSHQIFGDNETIFGYRSISINLYYLHNSARCYVSIKTSDVCTFCKPDDVMEQLTPWLPNDHTTNETEFQCMIENEKHDTIYGTIISEFKDVNKSIPFPDQHLDVHYKITKCDNNDEAFVKFHERFETFIYWYIDGASNIDLTDNRWKVYYVYEEFKHPVTNETYTSPVGYCTVYLFYLYPNRVRARISQFFILPRYQRRGIGSKLYEEVFRDIGNIPNIADITVEEPTPQFQKIRDHYDCIAVYNSLEKAGVKVNTTHWKKFVEFTNKYKICKKQSHRLYDILRCYEAVKISPSEYNKCVGAIRNRIVEPEKESRGGKRLRRLERTLMEVGDQSAEMEVVFKKYIDSLGPSIKYLQKNIGN